MNGTSWDNTDSYYDMINNFNDTNSSMANNDTLGFLFDSTDAPTSTDAPSTDASNSTSADNTSSDAKVRRMLQNLPVNFDWRNYGAVTNVKQQGNCGGCWSFCSIANIEGLIAIKYKKSINLSVQQAIDCDYSNGGCNGGLMIPAYQYFQRTGGIMAWNSYPFTGYRGYCKFNPNAVFARVNGYTTAGTTNEDYIMSYLYNTGPLAITMNARLLQYYTGGVMNVPYSSCPIAPDHGVTLVGYGTTSTGLNYWIIKNSWGPNWGEGGYFRIARGR